MTERENTFATDIILSPGPFVSSWVCESVQGILPCYSAEWFSNLHHPGTLRCDPYSSLASDRHCYYFGNVGGFVLLALYFCFALRVVFPSLKKLFYAGPGSYVQTTKVWRIFYDVRFTYEMLMLLGVFALIVSLFTDMVTPFEQVWTATNIWQAVSRLILGTGWVLLLLSGNIWAGMIFMMTADLPLATARAVPPVGDEDFFAWATFWTIKRLFVFLVLVTIAFVHFVCCLSYAWCHWTTSRAKYQYIGYPNTEHTPSCVRFGLRMFLLWIRVWLRSTTRLSLICDHNVHESRFRHFMRKEWKDAPEAAPCHDKVIHGHPTLAAERRGVHLQLIRLLNRRKYRSYDISTSRRTLRSREHDGSEVAGFHGHFSARDYQFPERNDEIGPNDALVCIDVDYYVDMHALASHFQPMCLYTFAPGIAYGHTSESSWCTTYDEDDEANVVYNVNGGNVYKHKLWDYGDTDYVKFVLGDVVFVYAIERHRPRDSTHMVVWLQPCVITHKGDREYAEVFAASHTVTRVVKPRSVRQDGDLVTIVDNNLEFQLRARLYQTIMDSIAYQKTVSAHMTLQFLLQHKEDLISGNAQYLAEWFVSRTKGGKLPDTLVYASVLRRPDGGFFKNELIATHEVMEPNPTNAPAATATKDVCSDAGAVLTRVTEMHNEVVGPVKYDGYIKEFCEGLAELSGFGKGTLSPLTPDELLERTVRKKTGEKILGAFESALSSTDLKAVFIEGFVKREAYAKPTDERQISPTNDEHLSKIAAYALPFKDLLCNLPNYMPGRTPLEIAEHIQLLMSSGEQLWETDFSRYDGQQSRWLRSIEVILFSYFFKDPAAAELVYNEIFRVTARCRAGSYSTGGNLCSGSSLTTIMNTAKHMLIQYITYREEGLTHKEATNKLFAAYGDDGILTGTESVAKRMRTVCDSVGLKNLKCVQAFTPERPYLTFVGRVFMGSDDGICAPSFQDPTRVWSRINLIQKGPDAFDRYLGKLGCFVVTDGNSPLLGAYCRKVLSFFPKGQDLLKSLKRAESKDLILGELVDQWLLVDSRAKVSQAWPNDSFAGDLHGVYASMLGITGSMLAEAMERVRNATHVDDLNALLALPQPDLNLRFVYKDIALSYGSTLVYDNNKKNSKVTRAEAAGIKRTAEHVLGKGACLLSSKGTKGGVDAKTPRRVTINCAPTGSGALVTNNNFVARTSTPQSVNEKKPKDANRSSQGKKEEAKGPAEKQIRSRKHKTPGA